ncbi:MAG: response regulator [Bacteroidales bacterium]|nr:response regulator [Bacteroidales bacterium]
MIVRTSTILSIVLMLLVSTLFASNSKNSDSVTIFTASIKNLNDRYKTSKELYGLFIDSDRATALKYGISMLESAQQLEDERKIAESNHILGVINANLSNYEIALKFLLDAYKYYYKHGNDSLIADYHYQLNAIYNNLNMPEQAVANAAIALKYYKRLGNTDMEASCNIRIANVFMNLKDYPIANNFLHTALKIVPESSRSDIHYEALRFLTKCYFEMDSIETALKTCKKILQRKNPSSKLYYLKDVLAVGDIYFDTGRTDSAIIFYEDAKKISESIGNFDYLGVSLTKFAHLYSTRGDWSKALEYNSKALESRLASGTKTLIASSYLNISGNYLKMGDLVNAEKFQKKGEILARETFHLAYIIKAQNIAVELYKYKGDYKSAYEGILKTNHFNDSLSTINSKRSAESIYYHYMTDMSIENVRFSQKNRSKITWIFIIALVIIVATITIIGFLKLNIAKQKKLNILSKEKNIFNSQNLDLTKRYKELSESESKYKALVETSAACIGITNDREDLIFVNQSFADILGYTREELTGMNLSMISPGQIFEKFLVKTQERKSGHSEIYESTLIRRNGHSIEVQVAASPYFDTMGNYAGGVGIITDLTQIRKLQNELLKVIENSKESDRLKTAFLANMSHEFRTPLNAILGGINVFMDSDISLEEKQSLITSIRRNSVNLLELWENILELSRLQASQVAAFPRWININEFGENILFQISKTAGSEKLNKIKIRFVSSEAVTRNMQFFTDETILRKIINSLLSNALKFTTEGQIDLYVDVPKPDLIQWRVIDTGIGIKAGEEKFIFNAFRQGEEGINRKFGGAGLGLAIAKGYIEELDGNIHIQNAKQGSVFIIDLPCETKSTEEAPVKKTSTQGFSQAWGSKTILVAEDVDSNYQFLEALLKKTEAKLIWAKNGEEAVEICKKNDSIDLILMDLQMPVMNGFEATAHIRKFKPNLTIIAQTAYAMIHDKNKALEASFTDFIAKPIRIKLLIELLSKYLD